MSELSDLYQEIILDHSKRPRNFRPLPEANHQAEGYNPLCGDRVTVFVKVRDGVVEDISFQGSGCAICTATASLMTESLKGKGEEEAEKLFGQFHDLLTGPEDELAAVDMGKLAALGGVRRYPIRVKCATLPWHTFHNALHDQETATTE